MPAQRNFVSWRLSCPGPRAGVPAWLLQPCCRGREACCVQTLPRLSRFRGYSSVWDSAAVDMPGGSCLGVLFIDVGCLRSSYLGTMYPIYSVDTPRVKHRTSPLKQNTITKKKNKVELTTSN
ncbi:uncharacterized protein BDV14DRAFT_177502 [Aspergillus stella-maris]|uniref:uncharacterized protein n=1 Tax=Aspergillus stella-maris TaxID=1810926 RepID=UPI003CCCB1A6